MGMSLGDNIRVTLFGESHGPSVGALLEGIPPGTNIDNDALVKELERRKPGRKGMSRRLEADQCEILSGVYEGRATGWPILIVARNNDAKSSDYGFLPDHPRPGHADMVEIERSGGAADLRGGGSQSARLTLGLVAAASQTRQLLSERGVHVKAHLHSVGDSQSRSILDLDQTDETQKESMQRLNCLDPEASELFSSVIESSRKELDSLGSSVECIVSGLPIGMGEPWFDGIEPALARAMMAIPGARAVEFGRGIRASRMKGSEHNDSWALQNDRPTPEPSAGHPPDGALGGRSTGAPLRVVIHFKPPSSIPRPQSTLHLPSGEQRTLKVTGRHDPVIGPRAVPVVEAAAILVIADLLAISDQSTDNSA